MFVPTLYIPKEEECSKNVSITIAVLGSCAVITAAAATAATLAVTIENFTDQQNASFGLISSQYNASDTYTHIEKTLSFNPLSHHTRSS